MDDLIGLIMLAGYAAEAWAQGFRAEDRTMLGMLLGVSDDDLDIICKFMTKWEKEEMVENL